MRSTNRIAALLFFASVAFQSLFIFLDAFVSDEGIVLVAANDVAMGRLLYSDVNIPLTPTVYLLQGLAFKIFGSNFMLSRLLICFVYAGCVVMSFRLACTYLPQRQATMVGALTIPLQIWMWPHAQFFSYNQITILLCLVAMRVAWSIETGDARRSSLLFGITLGLALWTKLILPVAIGAGVLLHWLSSWLRSTLGLPVLRKRGFGEILSEGLLTLLGVAAVSLPMVAYLVYFGILDEMVDGAIKITQIYGDSPTGLFPGLFPLTGQLDSVRMSAGLVLPGMLVNTFYGFAGTQWFLYLVFFSGWIDLSVRVLYYLPVALFALSLWTLAGKFRKRAWEPSDEAALLVFLSGGLLCFTNISFPAFHYITPTLLSVFGLATYVSHHWTTTGEIMSMRRLVRWGSRGAVAVYLVVSFIALDVYVGIPRAPVHTDRGTVWIESETAAIWNEMFDYTKHAMSPGDQIFVYPYFPLFYFLSGQDHPSRYVALGPGFPGAEAEDEIIAQLEKDEIEFVLNASGVEYPGLEGFEQAYPRLHHYLTSRFEVEQEFEASFGPYAEVLRRRPRGGTDTSRRQSP